MADEAFSLWLEKCEGSLDLLLRLIEKNKINVYGVPTAETTEWYMAYLSGMEGEDLGQLSEFLLVAATSLDIRVRILLPYEVGQEAGEEVDLRAKFVNRLLEHRGYELMAEEFADRRLDACKVFFCEPVLPKEVTRWAQPVNLDRLFQDVTLTRLQFVFREAVHQREDRIDPKRSHFGIIKHEPVSLKMQVEAIMNYVCAYENFSFRDLLEKRHSKLFLVVTFLAVLEFVKTGTPTASQESPTLDIYLEVSAEGLENRHGFSGLFDNRACAQLSGRSILSLYQQVYKVSEGPEVNMEFRRVLVAGGGVLGAQIVFQAAFKGLPMAIWFRSEGLIGGTEPKLTRPYNVYRAELARISEVMLAGGPLDLPRGFGDAAAVKSVEDLARLEKAVGAAKQSIRLSLDLAESVREAGFTIENVAEDREAKRELYMKLAPFLDEKTIVATSSSTVTPNMFSDLLPYPESYLVLYFANNTWCSNTAEIMGHSRASETVSGRIVESAKETGMIPLELKKEQSGYTLGSMLMPFLSVAGTLWANEVTNPETINKTWTFGTSSPYGPFQILDIVGLQTAYSIASINPEAKNPESIAGKIAAGLKAGIDTDKADINAGEDFYRCEK